LRDTHLAEDILQETWLKAIRKIDQFQPRNVRFSAWLFAIARNECREHWRKNKKTVVVDDTDIPDLFVVKEMSTDSIFVEELLTGLDEEDREILRLRYIADLPFKEVARVLSISPIAARVRVHRALAKARSNIETT
ncbi:MAG TPA: RNA polymerase sigma factor, partial [Candidatus Kapabacteria bacterium]|nr:RNA polymerase sigma factor [Candidatus Kapabacteria bacterium]